jgi:hypothetical protein
MPTKILLAGSVCGNIDALLKRAKSSNEKAGPFAAIVCVGQFFEDGDASAECPDWFRACIDGSKEITTPIYFVGGGGAFLSCPVPVTSANTLDTRAHCSF